MSVNIDPAALSQLVEVLKLADNPSTEAQRQVVDQLDYFSKNVPELPAYLVFIFALAKDQSELLRIRAGLSLKNTIQQRLAAFPPNVVDYIKESIWSALEDGSSLQIRNTASSVLDWLIRCIGPIQWPQAIARLVHYMNSPNELVKEVGLPLLSYLYNL
jgi:transportin-1